MQTVTLTLFKFETLTHQLWAFQQMAWARFAIARLPGLQFFKLMGTGAGAGFSTTPDLTTYTCLCVWDDRAAADKALASSRVFANYQRHAGQTMTLYLQPTRSRGVWSGKQPFAIDDATTATGPVVALTRATLAVSKARAFWARVPAISDAVEHEGHQHFMMGMGEVPWLHQVTFSVWSDEAAMRAFSLTSPTHGEAVKLAYTRGWFKEYLFARFNLLDVRGAWPGFDLSKIYAGAPPIAQSVAAE